MKNQEPEKIDVEKNPLGINFLKSKKVKKYFDENTFLWSSETTPGPVIGNKATIYTTSKRAMDLIKLEEQKILIQKLYRENHLLRCQSLIDSSNNNIKYKI